MSDKKMSLMAELSYKLGIKFFAIGALFVLGAANRTISHDSTVITIQWFCALGFFAMGIFRVIKNAAR